MKNITKQNYELIILILFLIVKYINETHQSHDASFACNKYKFCEEILLNSDYAHYVYYFHSIFIQTLNNYIN